MSKSKGNVVDPDTMIQKVGADALRLYVMFVAPPEKEVEWTDSGLEGSYRWLARVWHIAQHWRPAPRRNGRPAHRSRAMLTQDERALRRKTHDTIRRVTQDLDVRKQFNTAISAMMELVNDLYAFTEQQEKPATPSRATGSAAAGRARGDRIAHRHAVAVCAAHGRGTVGAVRPRRHAGRGDVAGVRRRSGEGRGNRDPRAGERQGAQPPDGVARGHRRRARGSGAGGSGRAGRTLRARR